MHLSVIPIWAWIISGLIILGEIDLLCRRHLSAIRLRRHILGGVALLVLILTLVPLADALTYTKFILVFWVPALIVGSLIGIAIARWALPVLYNSAQDLFYQSRDWLGIGLVVVLFCLVWLGYQLFAVDFNWLYGGMLMVIALTGQSFITGFFVGRNLWYIHEFRNVREMYPR